MDGDNNTLTCRWLLKWFGPNRALKHTPDGIDGIFFSNWHILLLARISFFVISNKQFKNQLWVCGFKPLNIVVVYKSYGTFVPSFHHWWTTEVYCYFTIMLVLRYLSLTKDISISMLQHLKPHTVMEGKYHSNIKHFVST